MKSKILLFSLLIFIYTAITVKAQQPVYPISNSSVQLPFGKKMVPPVFNPTDALMRKTYDSKKMDLPYTTFDKVSKQFIVHSPGHETGPYPASGAYSTSSAGQIINNPKPTSSDFHLTKDINTTTIASYPSNYPANAASSFAVLNNLTYFSADDGINGRELWRSDGTAAGTYLVKDIYPGEGGSDVNGIIAAKGLLFFSAFTADNGYKPWVSDGTELGTHLLMDPNTGTDGSNPNQFVNVNGTVFFIASLYTNNHQVWKTDGTQAGTTMVKDIYQDNIGSTILELTGANGLAYFIANTFNSGYQLFRSDGTDAGTYVVKETGYFGYGYEFSAPMQLTEYNGKLFFSVDDGMGRRLWTSDGTADGTNFAPGNNDIFMRTDFMNIFKNSPFRIINNILYISGRKTPYTDIGELYKYDASNADGIVLVKELTDITDGIDYVVPVDMTVVNDKLYFKVISFINGAHDELWSTNGQTDNTQLIRTFGPGEQGVYTYNFYNGNGILYFDVHNDPVSGTELWKSDGTDAGTVLIKDINPGTGSSDPDNLTFCNGKLLFKATTDNYGTELWASNGSEAGTSQVQDINTNTNSSYAGSKFFFKGIGISANGLVFNAFTPALGAELYKSPISV